MLNQARLRRGLAILALLSACAIIPQALAPAAAAPKQVKEGWTRIGAQPQKSHAAALMSDTPATCTLLLGLFAYFAVIRVKRWTGDTVGASAESIEGRQYWRLLTSNLAHVDACVEIKMLRHVRPESSRRPPRHRRDACSMVWRCWFLTARRGQHGSVIAEK